MKVHFVLPQLMPLYGMENAAAALMQSLAGSGCQVSSTVMSGGIPSNLAGIEMRQLGIPAGNLRLAKSVPALKRGLGNLSADTIIVTSGLWASLPVGIALLGTGRNYVAWEHSVLPARIKFDKRVALLFAGVDRRVMRPHCVVAVSDGVQRFVAGRWKAVPIFTIPNIVDVPCAPPTVRRLPEGRFRLLTTGAFRPIKNNLCAIEAMRYLPDPFSLRMAGDGPQEAELQEHVQRYGLADRVTFLGRVPGVRTLLEDSDLLVHPSLAETFGFSLVEAADVGLPVVAFPVETIDEMVPKYVPGMMAEGDTAESFATAIREASLRAWCSDDLSNAWRHRLHDMSAEAVASQWRIAMSNVLPG